jgi:hypothetical protein
MSADHVLFGKDDWLFLAEGTNRSISQVTGRLVVPATVRNAWRRALELRTKLFGDRVLTVICPEKSAAYPQHLPDDLTVSGDRFGARLAALAPRVLYPLPTAELSERFYPKTDTHWSEYGSYHVAASICDTLGIDGLQFPAEWTTRRQAGDLGIAITPRRDSLNWVLADPPQLEVAENGLRNRGRVVRYRGAERRARVVIFGDSFAGISLARQLAYRVGDVIFVHSLSFDLDALLRLRPDFVIGEVAERFLIEPVADGRSIASLIIEKDHQGLFSDDMLEKFRETLPAFEDVYGPSIEYLHQVGTRQEPARSS